MAIALAALGLAGCAGDSDGANIVDELLGDAGFNPDPPDVGLGDAAVASPDALDPEPNPAPNPEPEPQPEPQPEPEPEGPVPNEGWIGGPCQRPADCDYDGAICLGEGQGYEGGQCTLACDRFCPDRDGQNSVTFCVDGEGGQGQCASRCDYDLYPVAGCRQGYRCRIQGRFNEPAVQQSVCVPQGAVDPLPDSLCLQQLDASGVTWTPWAHSPEQAPGSNTTCVIEDPVRVSGPIGGVTYRYFSNEQSSPMSMSCPLALALVRLGPVLRGFGIREALHIGTYNCRVIGGTSSLSQHGLAKAIDFYGFVDDVGRDYILERDWEHDTTNPSTDAGQLLYDVAQRMFAERIFNIILTPNYNAAHDNHFHVDLTEGSRFIGHGAPPQSFTIGPNHGH